MDSTWYSDYARSKNGLFLFGMIIAPNHSSLIVKGDTKVFDETENSLCRPVRRKQSSGARGQPESSDMRFNAAFPEWAGVQIRRTIYEQPINRSRGVAGTGGQIWCEKIRPPRVQI